jgi:hypothetical protein
MEKPMNAQITTSQTVSRSRDSAIDWLKGISIIFVLLWHFQPIQIEYHVPKYASEKVLGYVIYLVNNYIFCLAVPTFILISLYLFLSKIQKLSFTEGKKNLIDRSIRVVSLYFFYVAVQFGLFFAFQKFLPDFSVSAFSFPNQNVGSNDIYSLIISNLFSGGPPLPIISYSVLYFLFDLAILTIVAFGFNKVFPPNSKPTRALSLIIITASIVLFEASPLISNKIYAHQLENFILYVPIAAFWARDKSKFLSHRKIYLAGYLLFIVHDIFLERYNLRGEMYSRTSMVFGALAFISFTYHYFSKNILSLHSSVKFMSAHSLGIFAIHKYVMLGTVFLAEKIGNMINLRLFWDYTISIGDIRFKVVIFLLSILTIALTVAIVSIIGKSKFKSLVM